MKKIITVVIIAIVAFSLMLSFAACQKTKGDTDMVNIKIVVPDGAPALAIAKLIHDGTSLEGYNISYEVVPGATEISAKLVNGEADFAIAPTNTASILYNNNAGIRMLSASTYGNLYLVGKNAVDSLNGLIGSIVLIIGQGGTPDLTFRYILTQKGIPFVNSDAPVPGKVALRYVGSGSELIPLLKQNFAGYGILGQPAVAQALGAVQDLKNLFAIHELWSEVTNGKAYTQAVFIGKSSVVEAHPAFVAWLLGRLEENVSWIAAHPAEAQAAIVSVGSLLTVTFDEASINGSNIRYVPAGDAKADVLAYLEILASFNTNTVGGSVPGDDFFYTVQQAANG
jgi:NitT/TauT family transport system substrate-binding protein